MTGPTHGNATAVVCGTCGEHIERAIWASGTDLRRSFVMHEFIDAHAGSRHHRVGSIGFEPMILAWHEM